VGKNILVLIEMDEKHKKSLEATAPGAFFTYEKEDNLSLCLAKDANIIIGNPPAYMLKDCKNLEWLQLQSAGIDSYIKEGILPKNTILTNATGAYGLAISEYMLGVLLVLLKKLHLYRDNQKDAIWSYMGQVKSIYNSTALVIGAGDIGGEFAKKLKALGAYVIGIKRTVGLKPDYLDELYTLESLNSLLPRASIVSLSLPFSKETVRIINKETLGLMRNDAIIINVGRGSAIDTEDLCDALEKGSILGAALDVTDPEPLPSGHRLWKMENVIITPHASGGFSLQETYERIIKICIRNLKAYINGMYLINVKKARKKED
jgi:phosphoglycerate dehydrogenase-like enzyme